MKTSLIPSILLCLGFTLTIVSCQEVPNEGIPSYITINQVSFFNEDGVIDTLSGLNDVWMQIEGDDRGAIGWPNTVVSGCEIYTSCEPCPMCLSAIYWSRLDKIYYANTRDDAKNIDFDDSFIYTEIPKKIGDRKIKMVQILREEALKAFEIWDKKVDKIKY